MRLERMVPQTRRPKVNKQTLVDGAFVGFCCVMAVLGLLLLALADVRSTHSLRRAPISRSH